MRTVGVPGRVFASPPLGRKSLGLRLKSFTVERDGVPRSFSKAEQADMVECLMRNPSRAGSITIASGSKELAETFAATVVQRAICKGVKCRWHTVMYGRRCALLDELMDGVPMDEARRINMELRGYSAKEARDYPARGIGLLVVGGVLPDSTQSVKEKLRDIVNAFDFASIVITTTGENPVQFARTMSIPAHRVVYIGSARRTL